MGSEATLIRASFTGTRLPSSLVTILSPEGTVVIQKPFSVTSSSVTASWAGSFLALFRDCRAPVGHNYLIAIPLIFDISQFGKFPSDS